MPPPLSFDHLQALLRQYTAGLPDVRQPSPNTRYTIQNAALEAVCKVSSSQSFEHQTRHRHIHKRLTGGW